MSGLKVWIGAAVAVAIFLIWGSQANERGQKFEVQASVHG